MTTMRSPEVVEMTDEDVDVVSVSRTQVRAAKELIRLRGEQAVHPVVRRVAGLQYEHDLLKALQRHQPEGAVLRRAAPAGSSDAQVDILLDDGQRLLVFEAKSVGGPLDARGAHQAAHMRDALRAIETRPVLVVLASRTGFTAEAERAAAATGIRLLQWADRDDDPALAAIVRETFEGEPGADGDRSPA